MKTKLYLLPGLMNNEKLWYKLSPLLENDFDLIHIPIPLTKSFDEAVEVIEKYLKEDEVNLLGFSLGAYMASYFTSKKPKRVKRLFLVAGTPSSLNSIEVKTREVTLNQLNTLNFKGLSTKKVKLLLEKENRENEELIKVIQDMFNSFSFEEYKMQMSSTLERDDIYNKLFSLDLPINFMFSQKDKLLNHKSLEKIKPSYTNIKIKTIEGSSHMIPFEHPLLLSQEIKEWIKEKF